MNQYHKKIEQLRADQALDQESLGEVLLDLDKQPGNKERKDQREKLEASITRRDTEMCRLQLMATTAEKLDTKATAEANAELATAAGKLYVIKIEAANARAPKIDKAIEDCLRLFTDQEADLNAAMRAGREAGIPSGALRFLLDLAPLGIALADRLARGGWTRLPFMDVTHPRNTASVEEMTSQRHAKALALLERARNKKSK